MAFGTTIAAETIKCKTQYIELIPRSVKIYRINQYGKAIITETSKTLPNIARSIFIVIPKVPKRSDPKPVETKTTNALLILVYSAIVAKVLGDT